MYFSVEDFVYFDSVEAQSILQCASCYRLHVTLSTACISWIDPCISCQCIVGNVLCCGYRGKRGFESWFRFWTFLLLFGQSWLRWKPPPPLLRWLAKGYCLAPTLLRTFVTYRLTFMAQHALLDFLGQDQVARLRSGSLEDYNSPCVPRWA